MLQACRNATWTWLTPLLTLVVLGCGRGSRDLVDVSVRLVVSPEPPQIGPSMVTVSLRDASGEPIENAEVDLEANMSHAGMVPIFSPAAEVAPGRYETALDFTMAGDWFILVRADLPGGRVLERRFDVPGVDVLVGEKPTP